MGGSVSTSRDYSKISSHSLKFDVVSQLDQSNEFKGGLEFTYDDLELAFGQVNKFLPEGNSWTEINQNPFRVNFYLQDKMEFKGLIATMGLILEHSNPNGDWYDVGIFDPLLYSQNYTSDIDSEIPQKKAKAQTSISPRLAISHPITESSKLYFNYGHYRQKPTSEKLYRIQRLKTNQLSYIGDPELPLARTVAYELGYDHSLFENYLFHLSAYYKDISDQEDWTRYISQDGKVNYRQLTANSYEDIRGFEFELRKIVGKWIIGNINFEYRVGTSGYFGYGEFNEIKADQREYESRNPKQTKPRPRPRFKSYIDFHTPRDYGATYFGIKPFGDWRLNLLANWTGGRWDTWNPNFIPGVKYNVQVKDTYSFNVKMSKTIPVGSFDIKLFMDVYNLFNLKTFSGESFTDAHDYNFYMKSLHLPSDITDELGYGNIPGEDKIGDVRKEGVDYQPMEWTADLDKVSDPNARAIYYDASAKKYMQYLNDTWGEASQGVVDKALDDKAYIDMPNQTYFTYLSPRSIFFGFTLSYNF